MFVHQIRHLPSNNKIKLIIYYTKLNKTNLIIYNNFSNSTTYYSTINIVNILDIPE